VTPQAEAAPSSAVILKEGRRPRLKDRREAISSSEAPVPDGERKTITALFADIKGSMELMEDLDPEEARAIIDPVLQLMMDAVRHYGGYVAQSTGDGIFALFGAPVAYEDHPQRALYAALRMQQELDHYADRLRAEGKSPLAIRIGANTGEVVVRSVRKGAGDSDYLPVGLSTGLAQRMQVLAKPGAIVISEHTRKLVEGYFTLKGLGPTKVKGLSEPINVFEVTGMGPLRTRLERSASRGFSRFVGRQREMEQMQQALDLATAGHGQVVAAAGEPGVGKSRLFYEFKLKSRSGCLVLETFSVSHGKALSYVPVVELLKNYFGLETDDDLRTRREKINGKVLTLDRTFERDLPFLFSLLSIPEPDGDASQMDPRLRARKTIDAVTRLLVRESLNQPLLIIFEDLHWLDPESQSFLNSLVESMASARILLLVNYRPEYHHDWNGQPYYRQLLLPSLGPEGAEDMVAALLGSDPALAAVRKFLVERTEGNPFFIEEMAQTLFDQSVLKRNGAVHQARPLGSIKVPATVQGLLASRIDRLKPPTRQMLQTLAVIGREFPAGLVRQVMDMPERELAGRLSELQSAQFIYEQPAFPEPEYSFKHALTHEVTYNSLLLERRRELHERIANVIESLFSEKLQDHLAELARHYERSANKEKAVEYLRRAGEQASDRFAFTEALTHLNAGLKLVQELPEDLPDDRNRARHELLLQIKLGHVLRSIKSPGADEAGAAWTRALDLSEKLGDDSELFPILRGLRLFCSQRLQLAKAREYAERMLEVANRSGDPEVISDACLSFSDMSLVSGDILAARTMAEKGLATTTEGRARARCLAALTGPLNMLGFVDQAARCINEAQALARSHGDVYWLAYALVSEGRLLRFNDGPRLQAQSEQAITICTEFGNEFMLAEATSQHGAARVAQGAIDEGIDEIKRGMGAWTATGSLPRGRFFCRLAEAYRRAGLAEEGLEAAAEGLALVERTGERGSEAELHRLRGELVLLHDPRAEEDAETFLRRAIEVACHQSAKLWELVATTSLARLLAKQGKRDEARTMLSDVYNWFTEGFDTADLKNAKALLKELSA
jgi:class 3 adenylate cyclase/tetratricopeptide (TPR) repeat protein